MTKIGKRITNKNSAIMSVHVYGDLCDVEAIRHIADQHAMKVICPAATCDQERAT